MHAPSQPPVVARWNLQPHPEGGWFRETYRAKSTVSTANGPRSASTAILYCLQAGKYSAVHRIASDELWHHHTGATFIVREFGPNGTITDHRVGPADDHEAQPQVMIPAGAWFAAWLADTASNAGCDAPQHDWGLVSCTVAPGFDFADFTLATAADLSAWPEPLWQHLVRTERY
jgi:predicted cupin superfamily sugar epimerase